MANDAAELSSLLTTLAEVERRLAAVAGRHEGAEHEDVLAALYEAERSLRATQRQIERAEKLSG